MQQTSMKQTSLTSKRRQRGGSIVEVALMAPWIFFLFVGIFDFGFYAYAAICTQNAARAVALTQAQTATATVSPCTAALGELTMLPNIGYAPASSLCNPVTGLPAVTSATPVNVCVQSLGTTAVSICGLPAAKCADCDYAYTSATTPAANSYVAVVTYQTIPLVPIPGILMGQMSLSRRAEERQTTP